MSQKYAHLRIRLSPLDHMIYLAQRGVGKVIGGTPGLKKLMRYCSVGFAALEAFGGTEANIQKGIAARLRGSHEQLDSSEGFGYEDQMKELTVAAYYRGQIESGELERKRSESGVLYRHVLKMVPELFGSDTGIKQFLDFGVSYGHIESVMAKQFGGIRFHGIDRSRYTKEYNEQFFSKIPNLKFHDGDVFELFKSADWSDAVFFHMRTAVLLPETFLGTLYQAVRERKFKYIVGIEQIGISRETGRSYEFSDDNKESVLYRAQMFLHNYPGLLKAAGYEVVRSELLKTPHITPDFRLMSFTAKRID